MSIDVLPPASLTVVVMVLIPETSEILAIDQLVVPEAVPEVLLVELAQVTEVTPTLSEAVPERLIVEAVAV